VGRTNRVFPKIRTDLNEAKPENTIKLNTTNPNISRIIVLLDKTIGFSVKDKL